MSFFFQGVVADEGIWIIKSCSMSKNIWSFYNVYYEYIVYLWMWVLLIQQCVSARENSLILCGILLMRMCHDLSTLEWKLYDRKQKWTYYTAMTAETNVKWMKSINNCCPFILNTHLSFITKCTGQRSGILDSSPGNNRETHAVDNQTLSLSHSHVGQFRASSSPNLHVFEVWEKIWGTRGESTRLSVLITEPPCRPASAVDSAHCMTIPGIHFWGNCMNFTCVFKATQLSATCQSDTICSCMKQYFV